MFAVVGYCLVVARGYRWSVLEFVRMSEVGWRSLRWLSFPRGSLASLDGDGYEKSRPYISDANNIIISNQCSHIVLSYAQIWSMTDMDWRSLTILAGLRTSKSGTTAGVFMCMHISVR